jgi:hypothetical protein
LLELLWLYASVLGQSILLHRLVWQRQASTVNWKGRIAKSVILNELIKTIASLMGKNGVIPLLLHSSEKNLKCFHSKGFAF